MEDLQYVTFVINGTTKVVLKCVPYPVYCLVSLSLTLKINMFQAKCHLLDTANHGLPVIVKSWLEREKKLFQKAKKSKLSIDWDKYRSAATVFRKACHHAYNEFIKNCLYENNNSNPKRLYSYIKNKQVDNFGVGPLKDNGKVYTEGKDKARVSNSQFANVFSTDKGDIPLIQICQEFNNQYRY